MSGNDDSPQKILIVLDLNASAEQVSAALSQFGFRLEQHLPEIGVLTGDAPAGRVDALRTVAGVKAVEIEQHYRLEPPDSPAR